MVPDAPTPPERRSDQIVGQVPPILWHYTDAAGLMGIVTSGALRLSNARFLNDQTEREYGWQVINNVLDEQIAKDDQLSDFFRVTRQLTGPVHLSRDTFVCSFSEQCDSISQWERYGASGHGYCLGVCVTDLLRGRDFRDVFLRRLIYSPSEQRAAVETVVSNVRLQLEQRYRLLSHTERDANEAQTDDLGDDTSTLMTFARAIVMVNFADLALMFKNPHFADESEWRLILVVNTSNDPMRQRVMFSQKGTFLKPHVDLAVDSREALCLPISNVLCGPKLHVELAPSSAEYFLRIRGYNSIEVAPSGLSGTWR